MCKKTNDSRFKNIGRPARVWAISAVHSETERLIQLHDAILERFQLGDKLVYLGNYTGYGENAASCVDEILTFRRLILSMPGMIPGDITYLRGAQEEMWGKLLQLQFASDPTNILLWMLGNGMATTLESYGISAHDGIEACNDGTMHLTKWTNTIRDAVRKHAGHDVFGTQLMRAAHTDKLSAYPILFVHAGLDQDSPLEEQGDNLWWAHKKFNQIEHAYKPFEKVVRGYNPQHSGINMNCVTATIDGGCGFGGPLVSAGFAQDGSVFDLLEA